MKILVLNSGSSSIKFQLIQMPQEKVLSSGIVERIGNENAQCRFESSGEHIEQVETIEDHLQGLKKITSFLLDPSRAVIGNKEEIEAVGHRVVHGGNSFSETCLINEEVKKKIREYNSMAPLHNPHNMVGIDVSESLFPAANQIAVFDTAFHQTIPAIAHKYAIPNQFYDENEIKVYGFHGTSHAFVVKEAMKFLPGNPSRIISIHLGNGCSITAVKDGLSIDTSLGFGPSNGLIMGTRSGDVDHSLIFYLSKQLNYDLDEIKSILDKDSGMLGLTGYSDLRDIQKAADKGDENSVLALSMNAYRIKKYIGAYTAIMNGLDAVIFTAGIGENSSVLRALVCEDMENLGIELDQDKNNGRSGDIRAIDTGNLSVRVLVVPTNEELEIARQSYNLLL